MKNEIIKWVQYYKVVFKDETEEDKIITPEMYERISEDLKNNKWITINGELFNPYLIKKIVKYKIQDGINDRLKREPEHIQIKVRGFMKLYKKEITMGVLENMINKAKGIDIY